MAWARVSHSHCCRHARPSIFSVGPCSAYVWLLNSFPDICSSDDAGSTLLLYHCHNQKCFQTSPVCLGKQNNPCLRTTGAGNLFWLVSRKAVDLQEHMGPFPWEMTKEIIAVALYGFRVIPSTVCNHYKHTRDLLKVHGRCTLQRNY